MVMPCGVHARQRFEHTFKDHEGVNIGRWVIHALREATRGNDFFILHVRQRKPREGHVETRVNLLARLHYAEIISILILDDAHVALTERVNVAFDCNHAAVEELQPGVFTLLHALAASQPGVDR